jgi:hypothetical protein
LSGGSEMRVVDEIDGREGRIEIEHARATAFE